MTANTTRPALQPKAPPLKSLADLGAALAVKAAPKPAPAPPPPRPLPVAPAVAAPPAPPAPPKPPEFKQKTSVSPTADSRTLSILAPLVKLLPGWPAVLPRKVGDSIRPLKVGALHDITALLPPGDAVAAGYVRRVLYRYRTSSEYTCAVAAADSIRYDLDNRPVGPVAEADRRGARINLQRHITRARDRRDQARAEPSTGAGSEKKPPTDCERSK